MKPFKEELKNFFHIALSATPPPPSDPAVLLLNGEKLYFYLPWLICTQKLTAAATKSEAKNPQNIFLSRLVLFLCTKLTNNVTKLTSSNNKAQQCLWASLQWQRTK